MLACLDYSMEAPGNMINIGINLRVLESNVIEDQN